ncbi:MAG: glycogen synthase GlgA [Candidatus Aminicenantes bacterium]|nr:glycogen synthase GlgA [Candidatus Aminicenantes bacterium]
MKIAFVVSEAVPYVKTGGLADVAAALPRALIRAGHEVLLVIPLYRIIRDRVGPLSLRAAAGTGLPAVFEDRGADVPALFLENETWFGRGHLYGTSAGEDPQNGDRFAWFCRAALLTMRRLGFNPEIVHLHDWQSAAAAVYLRFVFDRDPVFRDVRSVFTIHNLAYQGLGDPGLLDRAGWPEDLFRTEEMEFHGRVSLLKAGILYADAVTTVSPRYAREIQTPEFGCGLDGLLRARGPRLKGILNGIDEDSWNPQTDPEIARRFGPDDLSGKMDCKTDLLAAFGMAGPADEPVIGLVSRLAGQKGLDLAAEAVDDLVSLGVRLVVLGEGEAPIERLLRSARKRHPGTIGLKIGYDDRLARKIFAGSDLFLIPSRYEPCGLTQMYAQRYGSIPVVRAVGGLDDTVDEYQPETGEGTGFKFDEATPAALTGAVRRALKAWSNSAALRTLRRKGMTRDFSWKRPAEAYAELYRSLR